MTTENTTTPLTHWEKHGNKYKKGALLLGLMLLEVAAKAYAEGAFRKESKFDDSDKASGSDGSYWQTADGQRFDNPSDAAEYHQDVYGKGWD